MKGFDGTSSNVEEVNLTLLAAGGTGPAIAVRLSPTLVWCFMGTGGASIPTGAAGAAVATIPAGLRPKNSIWAEGNGAGAVSVQFAIGSDGNIQARHNHTSTVTVCRFGVVYYSPAS